MSKRVNPFNACVRELEKRRDALGVERDKLRRLADEFEALSDSAKDGFEQLQNAIDTLSQYA